MVDFYTGGVGEGGGVVVVGGEGGGGGGEGGGCGGGEGDGGGTMTFTVLRESCTLHTFTILRQNALTFTLPPPYGGLINVCERLHPLYFRLSIFLTSLLLLLMRKRGWWVSRAGGTATPKTGEF
jgi:hypothetical protein